MIRGRVLVWFSCGAASAVAAKLAVDKYRNDSVEVLYCDTLKCGISRSVSIAFKAWIERESALGLMQAAIAARGLA